MYQMQQQTWIRKHYENTIVYVFNWISSNFLSLNASKTELPQQVSKLNNFTKKPRLVSAHKIN